MSQLAPPPASLQGPSPPLEQLQALMDLELALLARAVGESLPIELADRVLGLRARRAALAQQLGAEPGFSEPGF